MLSIHNQRRKVSPCHPEPVAMKPMLDNAEELQSKMDMHLHLVFWLNVPAVVSAVDHFAFVDKSVGEANCKIVEIENKTIDAVKHSQNKKTNLFLGQIQILAKCQTQNIQILSAI